MSNFSSFNLSQFKSAFNVLAVKAEDRPAALATFLSDSLSDAAASFLIDGSDALNQSLATIKNSGKASFAVRARKVINGLEFAGFETWGVLSNFAFTKGAKFVGGNSTRCDDLDARKLAAVAFGEAIATKTLAIFAPKEKDNAHVDPLAMFGTFKAESLIARLAISTVEELKAAVDRSASLADVLARALADATSKAQADEKALAEATAKDAAFAAHDAKRSELIAVRTAEFIAEDDAAPALITVKKAKTRKAA